MFVLVKCVAEAVVEVGIRGLAGLVPGGKYACDVAEKAHAKYRTLKRDKAFHDDIQKMAVAVFEEAKANGIQAAQEVAPDASPEDRLNLELYLTQIPAVVQASLKRPDDPTGRSVPNGFALNTPDDVLKMLPARLPRFRPGDKLPGAPGWVLTEQLGAGGFGEVWLAKYGQFGSMAHRGAVKFCHGLNARDLEHELKLVERVMAEAGRHPGMVPLIAHDLSGDPPWVMYEYVSGGDLAARIREWSLLPAAERFRNAVAALRGLAATVGTLHNLTPPVVHRDLKPTNILIDAATGHFRVTDFGIGGVAASAALKAERTGESTRGGRLLSYPRGSHTPLYSSPQQREGGDPSPRDDVHALGVIGYQLFTGSLGQGVGTDFDDDLKEAGADDELIKVLKKCTAQKPERRYATAAELAEALTAMHEPDAPSRPTRPTPNATVPAFMSNPYVINCPSCGSRMCIVPNIVGRKIRCTECRAVFIASTPVHTPGSNSKLD